MGKQRSDAQVKESKVLQMKHEDEQATESKPAEAVSRLSANVAAAADVQSLQRVLGNKTVTSLIQRHAVSNVSFEYEDGERGESGPTQSTGEQSASQSAVGIGHELSHAERSGSASQSAAGIGQEMSQSEGSQPVTQSGGGLRHELGESRGSQPEESDLRQESGLRSRTHY